jgi:hypothetical protein
MLSGGRPHELFALEALEAGSDVIRLSDLFRRQQAQHITDKVQGALGELQDFVVISQENSLPIGRVKRLNPAAEHEYLFSAEKISASH